MEMDVRGSATLGRKQSLPHNFNEPIYRHLISQAGPITNNQPLNDVVVTTAQPDSDEHKIIANYAARLAALKTLTGQVGSAQKTFALHLPMLTMFRRRTL